MQLRLITAAVLGAMCAGLAHAETIGAPAADVKKGTIGVGLDYGMQEFKLSRGNFAPPNFDYDITDLKSIGVKAGFGIMDGIAVSARTARLSGGKINGRNQNGRIAGDNVEGSLWGVGLDAVLWQSGPFAAGLMARYTELGLDGFETRTGGGNQTGRDNVDLTSTEFALGASYTAMGSLTPYGGVFTQRVRGKTVFVRNTGTVTSENPLTNRSSTFGYAGIRYQTPWKVSVGAEVRTNSSWFANVGMTF